MHSIVAARTRIAYLMRVCVGVCRENMHLNVCVFELMLVHCTHSHGDSKKRTRLRIGQIIISYHHCRHVSHHARATGVQKSHTQPSPSHGQQDAAMLHPPPPIPPAQQPEKKQWRKKRKHAAARVAAVLLSTATAAAVAAMFKRFRVRRRAQARRLLLLGMYAGT